MKYLIAIVVFSLSIVLNAQTTIAEAEFLKARQQANENVAHLKKMKRDITELVSSSSNTHLTTIKKDISTLHLATYALKIELSQIAEQFVLDCPTWKNGITGSTLNKPKDKKCAKKLFSSTFIDSINSHLKDWQETIKNKKLEYHASSELLGLTFTPSNFATSADEILKLLYSTIVEIQEVNIKALNYEYIPRIISIQQREITKQEKIIAEQKVTFNLHQKDNAPAILSATGNHQPEIITWAEATTVAAGTKYKAYVKTLTSHKLKGYKVSFNGKVLPVLDGNLSVIEFRAAAGGARQADGRYRKSYSVNVRFKQPATGKDTSILIRQEYYVTAPAIQISSGAVNSLYKDCGNMLMVNVPALGASYNPSFSVTGGSKILGKKKGQVIIFPTAPTLTLAVSSGGTRIGNQRFSVKLVPKPEIIVYKENKKVNLKNGEKAGSLSTITVKAVCNDDSFKKNLPRDARYSVAKFEVMLVRGKRPVGKRTVNGDSINIRELFPTQREGDRLLIEVLSVRRKNFKNKSLSVPGMGKPIINIPLS